MYTQPFFHVSIQLPHLTYILAGWSKILKTSRWYFCRGRILRNPLLRSGPYWTEQLRKLVSRREKYSVDKSFDLRACLHEGGGPQVGEVRCGGSPHLSCKRDQMKMRDCMDRRVTPPKRVTSPTWGPPPPCKKALKETVGNLTWPQMKIE